MENIMKVALASCGNPDHFQDPNRPMYGCERNHYVTVKTLEEASFVCRKFIENNFLGGGNWIGGKVYENNKYIARISYSGKIMPPTPEHGGRVNDLTTPTKELVALGIGDVSVQLADKGLELAKAYFYKNRINAYACFLATSAEDNAELEHHWDRAEKEANKVLHSDSRHENSCIYLVLTEPDA